MIRLVCSRIYAPVHYCKQQNNQPAISVVVTERVEENPTSNNSHLSKTVAYPKLCLPEKQHTDSTSWGREGRYTKIIQSVTKQINKQINKQMITSPRGTGGRVSSVATLPKMSSLQQKIMRHAKKCINMIHTPEKKAGSIRHSLSV